MATPDPPHNPNRCMHKKGTALFKHSVLAPRDVSPLISCVAVTSSFLTTKRYPSGSGEHLEEIIMLANSVRQISLVVLYRSGTEHRSEALSEALLMPLVLDDF